MDKERKDKIRGIVYGVSHMLDELREILDEEESDKYEVDDDDTIDEMEENCRNLEDTIYHLENGMSGIESIAGNWDAEFVEFYDKYIK